MSTMNDNQKDSGVRTVTRCRICESSDLTEFLHLGDQPLANSFLKASDLEKPEAKYPLRTLFCHECNLVQLGEVIDPRLLFSDYIYFSSGMPAGRHWRDYAQSVVKEFIQDPRDLVVEIGSNDGHFLAVVKETHANILGVDPAQNIARLANERGIPTVPDFFSKDVAEQILHDRGPAKIIIANNVVGHIDDHHDLLRAVVRLLAPSGVFIMEAPYLADMFENLAFDTIYHEHLSYLALWPLRNLFSRFGLEVFDAKVLPIQGNSIRIFVARKGVREVWPSVEDLVQKELLMKMHEPGTYFGLGEEIENLKDEVTSLLRGLKGQGKRIIGYGAPAKGNTLLNYFQIGPEILDFSTEELPSKIGVYTPGMRIPVFHVSKARQNPPDYYFLLAWNYKDAVLQKEQNFVKTGGKFIMPIGRERIIL